MNATTKQDPYDQYRSSNLNDILSGVPFKHGRVRQIMNVGDYAFVEYLPWSNNPLETVQSTLLFHVYVGGEDTSASWPTLDDALIAGVAFKRLKNIDRMGADGRQ